jgi:hypothetical protein
MGVMLGHYVVGMYQNSISSMSQAISAVGSAQPVSYYFIPPQISKGQDETQVKAGLAETAGIWMESKYNWRRLTISRPTRKFW